MSENSLKIGLIGNSSVGKTSLIRRFVDGKFDDNYMSTIGVDYFEKNININNMTIKLIIQDTSGQERFRSIAKSYFKNVDGIILVFDVTNLESFDEGIKYWLTICDDEIKEYKKILVGNKIDLEIKKISKEKIENYAKNKQMKYFESSAKEGKNVELIFKELTELIISSSPEKIRNKNQKLEKKVKEKKCC